MEEQLNKLVSDCTAQISSAANRKELSDIKVRVLGKSGELTALLRNLKDLPSEERPEAGKHMNIARAALEEKFAEKFASLREEEVAARLASEKIDITIDKPKRDIGCLHPLSSVRNRIIDFFVSLGFIVTDSPEIETDYYNFEALNPPADRQEYYDVRPQRHTRYVCSILFRRTVQNAFPPVVLSVYRAQRRSRRDLQSLPRQRLSRMQGHGMDRDTRSGNGKPQCPFGLRNRSRRIYGFCLRHGTRPHNQHNS